MEYFDRLCKGPSRLNILSKSERQDPNPKRFTMSSQRTGKDEQTEVVSKILDSGICYGKSDTRRRIETNAVTCGRDEGHGLAVVPYHPDSNKEVVQRRLRREPCA